MPAFATNGADIPERLLQAHEDGRVVFFCGAGISYPAGLPGFSGLVEDLFSRLGQVPTAVQKAAIREGRYDTAIGLLEAEYVGGPERVREAIEHILTVTDIKPAAAATHEALLRLATNPEGKIRLVTTNFDRLFEHVIQQSGLSVETFPAPLLPIPKNTWNGLVYLHGLLPDSNGKPDRSRLVVSSGDFGLAYLVERWASRFVSTLFRNFTVCFVGYSINDPVLRYMTDALAADRQLGEHPPEMFAFGSYSKGKQIQAEEEWRAKNVTPILYREYSKHAYLHRTLKEWAKTYRDGVRGKEMIVVQHAATPPLSPSPSDYVAGRMLWALTDELAARRFANLDPVPPLGWLDLLTNEQFSHKDLPRFGVAPNDKPDEKLSFSYLRRPTPYVKAPWMCLADMGMPSPSMDAAMREMAIWLSRHLNDPKVLLWLAKQGGRPSRRFVDIIHDRIEELDRLIAKNDTARIAEIRAAAPNAFPSPAMRALWRVFLAGRVGYGIDRLELHDWFDRLKINGITPSLRMELREMLEPKVMLKPPFRLGLEEEEEKEEPTVRDLIDWELTLATGHVHSLIQHLGHDNPEWKRALPELLDDFTMLLRDGMDLARELGGAEDAHDISYIYQPSIEDNGQNHYFQNWPVLIKLTRDAWVETAKTDTTRAVQVAMAWWRLPYPVFKRLAMYAATQGNVISPKLALEWLLDGERQWLWSIETRRETIRLLVALSPQLGESDLAALTAVILNGPPRSMYRDDLSSERWQEILEHDIWLRLAKIRKAGGILGHDAQTKLDELEGKYPEWEVTDDDRDEMPFWISDGKDLRSFTPTPRRRIELIGWLKDNPDTDHWKENDWRQRCDTDYSAAIYGLYALSKDDIWPEGRWREALQVWAEDNQTTRSWAHIHCLLEQMPDSVARKLDRSICWWLRAVAKTAQPEKEVFFRLCKRFLSLPRDSEMREDILGWAINHPIGLLTEALLDWWYKQSPKPGAGLPEILAPIFTKLCNPANINYRAGRVVLAARTISFFRVDEPWARQNLIPLFDWGRSTEEARIMWHGFMWAGQLYRPFLEAVKQSFLDAANYYGDLRDAGPRYAEFLALAAVDRGDTFTVEEMRRATSRLPLAGLVSSLHVLARSAEGAGQRQMEYWKNRIRPYLHDIWPKSRRFLTEEIKRAMAELCVAAGEAFPAAYYDLKDWLYPVQYPELMLHRVKAQKIIEKFPEEALDFMDKLFADDPDYHGSSLKECLDAVVKRMPGLANDGRHERLTLLLRKRGWLE